LLAAPHTGLDPDKFTESSRPSREATGTIYPVCDRSQKLSVRSQGAKTESTQPVGFKPLRWSDNIIINHSERPKTHRLRIVIATKRESVIAI